MDAVNNYKSSILWKRYLLEQKNDEHDSSRDRLRVAYDKFFENSKKLSQQIQKDLPNLTLHDENHYNALWRQASKIWNVNIELTPLEVFILGCAILVHDLANSTYAFEKGIDSIKDTAQWKDNVVFFQKKNNKDILDKDDEKDILLNVLRHIHANQAEKICEFKCKNDNNEFHIFEDDELRTDLGELIGKIGASHHWNIDRITEELDEKIGAPSYLPDDWFIRPILIACLLRCADATQIDQARAPNFLYSLLNINGISKDHWLAQSRLSPPILDEKSNALIFSSSKSFEEKDANAWWLVFDALKMANGELISSNNVIKDIYNISFKAERIKDCESPDRLKRHIKTKDWEPVRAEVKISQPEKIIDMFSGEELYGENYFVPIRELIQNAADSIKKRRTIEKDFDGKIQINLRSGINDKGEEGHWLDIDDDGIGMSKNVLTGTLIDFGASYMTSSIAFDEYPGLIGNRPEQIGKFGIGFFSIFMISNDIDVISKPFDKGTNDYCKIKFRDGKKLRPLVSKQIENLPSNISTRVSLFIKNEVYTRITSMRGSPNKKPSKITVSDMIDFICVMIDVDVYSGNKLIHSHKWYEKDLASWYRNKSIFKKQRFAENEEKIKLFLKNLRLIDEGNPKLGCLSICPSFGILMKTSGGLNATIPINFDNSSRLLGAIETIINGTQRLSSNKEIASIEQMEIWANKQYEIIRKMDLTVKEKLECAYQISLYNSEPTDLYYILYNRNIYSLNQLLDKFKKGDTFLYPVRKDYNENYTGIMIYLPAGYVNYGINANEIDFLDNNIIEAFNFSGIDNIYSLDFERYPFSFMSSLKRLLKLSGYELIIEFKENALFGKYIGLSNEREKIYEGKELSGIGFQLSANKIT